MHLQLKCTFFNRLFAGLFMLSLASVFLVACSGPVYKSSFKPAYQNKASYQGKTSKKSVLVKARSLIGKPYRYGGNHPSTGFDCSGFVQYTHAAVGINLPRTSYQQYRATHPISKQQLRPGDLVFFRISRKRSISHVGIYLGNGKFIHSPSSGKHVSIAKLDNPYWQKAYSSAGRVF